MADSIQDRINQQAEVSKNDMLWGKPANDILNGRDMSASAKPIRAIWEMVQNARDVSVIAAEWMYHPYHFEMYQS